MSPAAVASRARAAGNEGDDVADDAIDGSFNGNAFGVQDQGGDKDYVNDLFENEGLDPSEILESKEAVINELYQKVRITPQKPDTPMKTG